jgi:predicted Rossmann fold flavoprotein
MNDGIAPPANAASCRAGDGVPSMAPRKRVIVIGAGAAGSMAAIFAAQSGAETLLVERTKDGGRKILVSGGGRCNILPARLDESRFVTDSSPNSLRKIVRAWPLEEQIAFFEGELGIKLVEETASGKLFPLSNKARDVRDGLLAHAARKGVRYRPDSRVLDVVRHGAEWRVEREGAPPLDADAVIIATGGLSVPATGSDGDGISIARRLGLEVHPTYPALTPITAPASPFTALAGVSLPVTITARDAERAATATGGFLFTHRGYSGPSVLDVSHVAVRSIAPGAPSLASAASCRAGDGLPSLAPRARLTVKWTHLDEKEWTTALTSQGGRSVASILRERMPSRLGDVILMRAGVDAGRLLSRLKREERTRLVEALVRCDLPWNGDEGYKKAEVTGGGVSLAEVDPRTMECRKHPGLFLCGEVLDAFGPIGGYNFVWAWVTGRAAGLGAARREAGTA